MNRCTRCLLPDTKPGVRLDEEGVCQACRHHEARATVDWEARWETLKQLCDQYRGSGPYDCLIPVSGGKDSTVQVHVFKHLMKMNPLLVTVTDPFTHTAAGEHNIRNIRERFGCDMVVFHINEHTCKRMMRIAFEEFGSPTWPIDRAIYAYPMKHALQANIPLVVYGENVAYEYGGVQNEETYSAKQQIHNDVAKEVDWRLWTDNGIDPKELAAFEYPAEAEVGAKLEPIFLSYFRAWDGFRNYRDAQALGFKDLSGEWDRKGYAENYQQVDSKGYLMNAWMKFPKFGHQRVTDVCSYWLRAGTISKELAQWMIDNTDHLLDAQMYDDFCRVCGYTREEAWAIVKKHDKGFCRDLAYHLAE